MNTGTDLILAARARQLQPQAAASILQRLASLGADVAGVLDDLVKMPPPADVPDFDLFAPKIVFIGEYGDELPDSAGAVAFLLPEYRRMFEIEVRKAANWAGAKTMGPDCRTLGHSDWYLPKAKEMELLVCRDHSAPATYPALAPFTPFDDWYWTSNEASDSSFAFSVLLHYGDVDWSLRYGSGLVRLCREVPASQCQ